MLLSEILIPVCPLTFWLLGGKGKCHIVILKRMFFNDYDCSKCSHFYFLANSDKKFPKALPWANTKAIKSCNQMSVSLLQNDPPSHQDSYVYITLLGWEFNWYKVFRNKISSMYCLLLPWTYSFLCSTPCVVTWTLLTT